MSIEPVGVSQILFEHSLTFSHRVDGLNKLLTKPKGTFIITKVSFFASSFLAHLSFFPGATSIRQKV
jgi:hypothetical protein